MERKRQNDLISAQRKMHEERLKHEEESISRQEKMRRETINYEAKLRLEQEQARIEAQRKADAKNERDINDLILDRISLKERERRSTMQDLFTQNLTWMRSNVADFFSNPQAMGRFIAFAATLYATFTITKQSALLFRWYYMMKLQKPPLVRETSVNISLLSRIKDYISTKKNLDL